MNVSKKLAAGFVAAVGLAAGSALAHPGGCGMGTGATGNETCAGPMQGGMHGGMGQGMGAGRMGGRMGGHMGGDMAGHKGGGMGPGEMQGGGQSLMTPEERTAFREKMRNATTPEERQKLAAANHAEMQKRAQEKGVTLPQRGPRGGHGPHAAPKAE